MKKGDIAKASGIGKDEVTRLEARDDIETDLTTLRRYVEALGGTLTVNAVFGSCAISIEPASQHVKATADFLKSLRKQAGITRAELAKRLALEPAALADLEAGRAELDAKLLRKALQALAQGDE